MRRVVREKVRPGPRAIGVLRARRLVSLVLGLSGSFIGCNAIFGIDEPTPLEEATDAGRSAGGTLSSGGSGGAGGSSGSAGRSAGGRASSGGSGGSMSGSSSGGSDAGRGGDGGSDAAGRSSGGSGGGTGGTGGTGGGGGSGNDGGTGGTTGGNAGSPSGGRSAGGQAGSGTDTAGRSAGGMGGAGGRGAGGAGAGGAGMGGAGASGSGGMPPVDPCDLSLPGPEMVLIPAGQGPIGTTDLEITDAQPVITVMFDDYCIDRTEVTLGHYKTCVAMSGCVAPAALSDCNWSTSADTHPVNCIDHARAVAYCEWAGKRLPSEKEWEHAARGPEGRTYPWGNQAPSTARVNYMKSSSPDGTTPVGSLPTGATPGTMIHDLAGNVWEWTDSIFCAGYAPGAVCQPGNYTARGGSYASTLDIHVSPSWHDDSNAGDARFGFRCVYGDGEK
jgi:formylglycine-generating enzyme required for sulfatase activity